MTPTKLLIGQILIVFSIVIAGVWGSTEWCAWQLGFQDGLGAPWLVVFSMPVYLPWRLFEWWYAYDAYAPAIFNRAGGIAAFSGILGCAAAIAGSLWRARQNQLVTTYGSSRWATHSEIKQAGLFRAAGVFIGCLGRHYLRHDGPEHVMAFAPTRSGKGVGLVVPTLLSWMGSVVVHDIKGENWRLTAGWRSRFSHAVLFNPTDARSARFNPLLEVRKGPDEIRDVQNIADILVDPEGALERRSHWEKTSHSLLVGAILHVLYAEQEKTLARVATFLSDPQRPFASTLRQMMATNHWGTPERPRVHPVVASAAREVLNKSESERSGVLSTAMSFLGLYRDPVIAAATAACDWRIADLVDGERPMSLYLVIPPSDISRTKPLIRLVLNQIGRRLTERLEGDPNQRRHQLLLMLDEFPALGRLDFFESTLAFMAGYGIRAYMIAQSLNQISKAYGENNAILDNCHVRIAFSSNDERTARRISDALGTATELRAMRNYAGHRLAPWLAHVMVSRQETARPLLTPGEVMQLPTSDQLVMISGLAPIRAKKLRYYEDRNFTDRVLPPPELLQDGCRDRPAPRADDWGQQVRSIHAALAKAALGDADRKYPGEGGLQQQHPPAVAEQGKRRSREVDRANDLWPDEDKDATDGRDLRDRLQDLGSLGRAHAINGGERHHDPDRDVLPDF